MKTLVFILMLVSVSAVYSSIPHASRLEMPDNIKVFIKRSHSAYLALSPEDFQTIKSYADHFFQAKNKNLNDDVVLQELLFGIKQALVNDKIPENELSRIRHMATALSGFNIMNLNATIDDVLWWCALRSIETQNELIVFLRTQLESKRREAVLAVLMNQGFLREIHSWYEYGDTKNLSQVVEITGRKRKLIDSIARGDANLSEQLSNEIELTLNQIIALHGGRNELYADHLNWLLFQANKNQHDQAVKSLLLTLSKNWLAFNGSAFQNVSVEHRSHLYQTLHERIGIDWKAQLILHPNTNQSDWERQQYKNHIDIRNKAIFEQ